jgi:hypothetical protein
MKILKDGKEIKEGEVIYDVTGRPDSIRIDGVFYDINAFELVDTKDVVKTKGNEEKSTKPAAKKVTKKSN